MGFKICLVTDQHISSNPRLWKEAGTLSKNGYEVVIVTIHNSAKHKDRDKAILANLSSSIEYIAAANMIPGEISFTKRLFYKLRTLFAIFIKKLSFDTIYLLSRDPDAIFNCALKQNADLYIGHVDCSLYVGKRLIESGKKVAFDFEDWYSEDYIHKYRPFGLLKKLEAYAIENSVYISCPSFAMAAALSERYRAKKTIEVIYNGFSVEPAMPNAKKSVGYISLVWFSQTIGEGRGIENILKALTNLSTPVKLVLIGDCSDEYRRKLNTAFPFSKGHHLEIMGQVPHGELHTLLTTFDIGLALENTYPLNRNKTITNKILQYLQAGIKVLATNTDGQLEVGLHFPDAMKFVNANDATNWNQQLEILINTDVDKDDIIECYNAIFSWQQQEIKLLQLVSDVFNK